MKMSWAMVAAVNSEEVLQRTLLASGEHLLADSFVPLRGYASASEAYNVGIRNTASEILVFAHQDLFIPQGWADGLDGYIGELTVADPNWGILGLFGVNVLGEGVGFVYSTGLRRYVGRPFRKPIQVRILDEIVLIIRRSSGLIFDEKVPGFHLYGADICLEAERRGMRNYVLPCFAVHNSCGVKWVPWDFWRAYIYLRRKWKDVLPVHTTCTKITWACMPVLRHVLGRSWAAIRKRNNPGSRVKDPAKFYEEHLKPSLPPELREAGSLGPKIERWALD